MTTWRGPRERGRTNRLRHRSWTDPRLLLGGLLVLGATALGSWVVAESDDRVGYWAVAEDVVTGDPVRASQLVETKALLDDATAEGALRVDEELPAALEDLAWSRDVGAGSLLARDALGPTGARASTELPLAVATGAAPQDLRRGELVDVWVGPAPGEDPTQAATLVLEAVPVVSTGESSGLEGGAGSRTVLVDVAPVDLAGDLVGRVSAGHVTLVRRS